MKRAIFPPAGPLLANLSGRDLLLTSSTSGQNYPIYRRRLNPLAKIVHSIELGLVLSPASYHPGRDSWWHQVTELAEDIELIHPTVTAIGKRGLRLDDVGRLDAFLEIIGAWIGDRSFRDIANSDAVLIDSYLWTYADERVAAGAPEGDAVYPWAQERMAAFVRGWRSTGAKIPIGVNTWGPGYSVVTPMSETPGSDPFSFIKGESWWTQGVTRYGWGDERLRIFSNGPDDFLHRQLGMENSFLIFHVCPNIEWRSEPDVASNYLRAAAWTARVLEDAFPGQVYWICDYWKNAGGDEVTAPLDVKRSFPMVERILERDLSGFEVDEINGRVVVRWGGVTIRTGTEGGYVRPFREIDASLEA